jgi:hypothetical protein
MKLEEKYHYTYMDCLIRYTLDRWEVLNRGLVGNGCVCCVTKSLIGQV